jgi:hypothetical protein
MKKKKKTFSQKSFLDGMLRTDAGNIAQPEGRRSPHDRNDGGHPAQETHVQGADGEVPC